MAEDDSIKLLSFWSSPFALRVQFALELKGLKYELLEEEGLLENRKSDLLLESNPVHKKIPVLIHNGRAICESMNIVQYLDEMWPADGSTRPGFLPQDAFGRAQARFCADFVDKKFMSLTAASFRALVSKGDEQQKALEEYTQDCLALEGLLSKNGENPGPFFGGSKIGFADIALSFLPWWIIPSFSAVPDRDLCPRIHKWMEAIENTPEAIATFPDRQVLAEFIKSRFEKYRNAQ